LVRTQSVWELFRRTRSGVARRAAAVAVCVGVSLAGWQCVQDLVVTPDTPDYVFSVLPDSTDLNIGDTLGAFTATLTADGTPVTFQLALAVVEGPQVVTVDSQGRVAVLGRGVARIEARPLSTALVVDTLAVRVAVRGVVPRLGLPPGPAEDTLRSIGDTLQLRVAALTRRGDTIPGVPIVWRRVSGAGIATLLDSVGGRVRADANGLAEFRAVTDTATVLVRVRVRQAPRAVVSTDTVILRSLGQTASLGATIRDARGVLIIDTTVAWTSLDPGIASVTAGGTVTALANGVARIEARAGGAADTTRAIVAQLARRLVIVAEPTGGVGGSPISPAIQVAIADSLGSTVTGAAAGVAAAIASGTGTAGALLSGNVTVNASNGVASFGNLIVDLSGLGYRLVVSSGTLVPDTSTAFNVSGPPARLAFIVEPSAVTAGAPIAPAVQVAVQDSLGLTVANASSSVTVALAGGAGPAGANLRGPVIQSASNGAAVFSALSVDSAGSGFRLVATASGLAPDTSIAFTVNPAPAARLRFTTQPTSAAPSATIAPAVQVTVRDSLGNRVTGATNSVTVAIASGTGTAGATLSGTRTVTASAGVASFSSLSINLAGTGYRLVATATGLTPDTSATFAIQACTDPFEPNETIGAAAAITPGTPVTAKVCSLSDSDYFSFSAVAGQRITVILTPPASLDYHVSVYNPSQAQIVDLHTGGVPESTTVSAPSTGLHYIRVYGFGASSTTLDYTVRVQVSDLLTVSPATVSETDVEGSTAPRTTDLTLTGTAPLSWTATRAQSAGWLSLSAPSGTTPSTLTLTLNPSGLAAGTYRDTVIVTAGGGAAGSPDSTPVTFTITCTDAFEPNESFGAAVGITSGTPVTAKICTSVDDDFFSIAVTSGQTIQLALTPPPGLNYIAEIYSPVQTLVRTLFTSGNPSQTSYIATTSGTHYVKVYGFSFLDVSTIATYTMTATLLDVLTVTPTSVTETAPEAATTPRTADLTLTGSVPLAWTAVRARNSAWLSLSAPSGTTPSTLTLTMDPTGLAQGTYWDTVIVTAAGATGSPDSTPVTLTITCTDPYEPNASFAAAAPITSGTTVVAKICTSADEDYYSIPVVAGQRITASMTGPPQDFDLYLYDPSQTLVGVSASGGSTEFIAQTATATGTYYVRVDPFGSGFNTTTPYNLTVLAQDVLTVTPTSVVDSAGEGTTTARTKDVTLSGTAPLGWTATRAQSSTWLSLSAPSGTTPSTLTLTMNPTGLAPGTYRDTVIVTSAGAAGSPDSTPVTFTIQCSDAYEPNGSFATASPLTSGVAAVAKLCTTTDSDYYSIGVVLGQTINLALTPPTAFLYNAELYSPAQNSILTLFTNGNPAQTSHVAAFTGTYYVRVYRSSGSASPTLTYTLTVTLQDQLTVTPATVTDSADAGSTTVRTADLSLSGTNPLAWTATRAQSSGWLSLNAPSGTTPSTLTLSMNPTGLSPGTHRDTVIVTAAGAVGSPDVTPVTFRVRCVGAADVYEPNNTQATATAVTTPAAICGLIALGGDQDYFGFAVTAGQTITVAMFGPPEDFDLALFNPSQSQVASSGGGGSTESMTHVAAASGTYAVQVRGFAGAFNAASPYTLTISVQ